MAKLIRYGLLLCIYMVICSNGYSNKIDSLLTNEDVSKFLTDNFSDGPLTSISYTSDVTVFFKSDIDNNGLTDLLLKTDICIAILDKGKGQYSLRHIFARERENYDLITVLHVKGNHLVVVRGLFYEAHIRDDKRWQDDTLIYKFGDFIEYNAHPPTEDIEEINFKLGGGYPGRVWDLKIDAGGWVTLEKDYGARIFAGEIDSIAFNTMKQTINYIDLPVLIARETRKKPMPSTLSTSEETFTLEIKFRNGQTTKIYDYGGIGTYGLKNLYKQFFNIAENLNELN